MYIKIPTGDLWECIKHFLYNTIQIIYIWTVGKSQNKTNYD